MMDDHTHVWHGLTMLASGLALKPVGVQPLVVPPAPASPFGAARPPATRAVLAPPSGDSQAAAPSLLVPGMTDGAAPGLWAAMVAHAAAHLRHSPASQPSSSLKPLGQTVVSAIEDARVERLLMQDYPGVRSWFEAHVCAAPPAGDLGFRAFMARLDRVLLLPDSQSDNHWVNKARELFEQAVRQHGLEDYAGFRRVASVLANDLGQMRVRMDPQHYSVPTTYRDDNSYLWQHPASDQAEDEPLSVHQSAAPPPPAAPRATAQSTEAPPTQVPEQARYTYPEWDRKTERLKADWCTVIEKLPGWQGQGAAAQRLAPPAASKLGGMRLPHARQLDRRHRLRRQWEGEEVDLNAAIDVQISRRLNLRPEPRLFLRSGRGPKPTSLLVLLDVSESVNDPGDSGVSLLALEKQAALLLAQSAMNGVDRLAIHGFSSNTRHEVNYYRLLDFGQPCTPAVIDAVGALTGRYSTRMGAALRHASELLQSEPDGQRNMLVITDGAPSDVDVHDSRYLIEDARHAVLHARKAGVRMGCLAVDAHADEYVRHIFGWRNFGIADNAQHLPQRLAHMSARLAAGR
ncbi:MAG: VWA domain-containing protein [Pseudomonadota bacterium]|nr:VWA domain-containing protein [Pseudomonadota bacterium]